MTRELHIQPWDLGKCVSKRRFRLAAEILAPAFVLVPLYLQFETLKRGGGGCPLLG